MQYFTIQARSNREAIEKMKVTYGEDARILTHRAVRLGGMLGMFSREGVEVTGYLSDDGPRKRRTVEVDEEKRRILENARREQTLQQLLKEVQGLRESLAAERPAAAPAAQEVHPSLARLEELLTANEFTPAFAAGIHERVRETFSLGTLEDWAAVQNAVVQWIGEGIAIDPPPQLGNGASRAKKVPPQGKEAASRGPQVIVLVGPTGVGKTTTVAKLAAAYGLGDGQNRGRQVRIVTIDNYRIAARQQIETYAEIMRIPVTLVESAADLARAMALASDADLVLVDTIGRSPRDYAKLAEMKEILAGLDGRRTNTYLAVSACTKSSDLEEILRQFEPFGYRAVVLTKLDETNRVGPVISTLALRGKPFAWLCDGQGVPQDIEEASALRLLMSLEGVRIDREGVAKSLGERARGAAVPPPGAEEHRHG